MKKYQYQIIRYVHDHFTGEYVNVGVVVYSKDDRFLASLSTSRYQRITHFFPEAKGRWIMSVLANFNQQIRRISLELNELFSPSNSLEEITNSILIRDNAAIQLTETRLAVDVDLEAALNDLYNSQVVKYMPKNANNNTLLDEDVWRIKYKAYFEKYGIDKRLKTHDFKVPRDVISFQKSWKNNIWHCYEPLSFVLQEKDSIKDKVYKWAGRLQGLQQSNESLHLTLMTSISPKHKDLMAFVQEYLIMNTNILTVDIVTEDNAENLAKEICREMELHDMKQ
ncbi:MAG TPA: DUF3037 domain-containing protein [Bacteroidetes bacterium]|nr:DUF3037 domain-containing protein [Bacteroidota bacterium]